jgi:Ca2+-binding EF-hand superfamily protein
MDKVKEVVNNPALLEEKLKEFFDKVDTQKKGYITPDELQAAMKATAEKLNLPKPEREPTEEEKEQGKKLADPTGSGKITFEGFRALSMAIIAEAKKRGKL